MQLSIKKRLLARATWLKLHLYLALSAGFFFALLGLTGSLSVYREELDELFNPQLVIEPGQGEYQSLDKIMAAVQSAHPDRHGSWTLEMPRTSHSMITVWYEKPRETFFEWYAPLMVSVNPYTAEVVASRFWGQTLATWILDLHTQLRLDGLGRDMVGVLALLLIISVCTGLYLWWPGIAAILESVKIRYRAGMMRFIGDIHQVIGLLSAFALLLLGLTGLLLSYPRILETLTGSSGMAHGETGRPIISTAIPNNHPVGLESAEFVARGPFPRARLRRITTPAGSSGIYRINLQQSSEINHRHPFTTVWVDRWSGQIKEVRNPAQFSAGETFTTWIWPLHTGEALGSAGRVAWFMAGQSLFFLFLSGLLRWLCRRGTLRDREVDFTPLVAVFYRFKARIYRAGRELFQVSRALLKKAVPLIAVMLRWVGQWLLKIGTNLANRQQKRIGKDG